MNALSFSLEKIKAVALRFWYIYYNAYGRLIDICFWPLRDCLLWGLTGAWMAHQQQDGLALQAALLAGVAFWQIILRTSSCVGFAVFEEIISHNMINVLVSPLKLREWLGGIILISSLMGIGVLFFSALTILLLYKINILAMGAVAILAIISCLFIGLSLGFLAGGFMIRNGSSMFWFIYIAPWALAPFIGVYYALDVLPIALHS
jgi:ABC-2 type transport system permease protein